MNLGLISLAMGHGSGGLSPRSNYGLSLQIVSGKRLQKMMMDGELLASELQVEY